MQKHISLFIVAFVFFTVASYTSLAQTCSVNAGTPFTICVSTDSFLLTGNATGAIASTATWSLVSGPNIPVITSPSSSSTSVRGFVAGTYRFRYAAKCSDSIVAADSVTITINAMPVFTAGRDTFVCGTATAMRGTLPAGATGSWTFKNVSAVNTIAFGNLGSPASPVTLSGFSASCPKAADAIWTVIQGACIGRDTARVSFGGQYTSLPTTPDQAICGISYTSTYYYYGCGGNLAVAQLSGPGISSISYSGVPSNISFSRFTLSGLISGNYVFAVEASNCSGSAPFRDTFNLTVVSTLAATNPGYVSKTLCYEQFDTVYYFEPATALLPGETLTWNLTPTTKNPSTLPNPTADTIGNVLRLRNVLHPDSTATTGLYRYDYSYTVSNGTCSTITQVYLGLYSPLPRKSFVPVLNLPCGTTTANIAQFVSGSAAGYSFARVNMLAKPPGTPDPVYPVYPDASSGAVTVRGLSPGKYVFSFMYYRNTSGCGMRTASVEVNVSAAAGLSNAGSHQILPCGVDSSVLAGNMPPSRQTGTWQLVSGPSTVVLTNPHSASLLVKSLLPGSYTFRWEIAYGATCPVSSDEMRVTVTPTAPVTDAGPDKTVCYGYSIPVSGTPFTTGTTARWRQITGPAVVIADSTTSATSISGTVASSVYSFTYTLSNVCGSNTDTVVITTGMSQGPSNAVITSTDTCITSGSTTLRAIAPVTGTGGWSQLSGPAAATIAAPASNVTSVTGLVGGVYRFLWSVAAPGCETLQDTVSIAYRTGALTANAGADRYVCKDTIHLNATAPAIGTGAWKQIAGSPTTIVNQDSAMTAVSGLMPGGIYDYRWTVALGACPAISDDIHVVISIPPSAAKAMNDTVICGLTMGVSDQLLFPVHADTPTSGTGTWTILETPATYNLSGIANAGAANTSMPLQGGYYKLQWKVGSGACPASYDTVKIDLVPKADAGTPSVNLCEKISYTIRGTNGGTGTVLWSQLSGPTVATITNPDNFATTISGLSAGTYKFKYEVMHPVSGCSSFDTVRITNSTRIAANAGSDSVFCWRPGSTTLYLNADTPASGSGAWSRTSGAGTVSYSPNANSNPANASVNSDGLHQFKWTVTNGSCQSADYKDVLVEKLTVPPINFNSLTACMDSFTVSVTSPYANFNYAWAFQRARINDTAAVGLTGPFANNFLVSDTNNIYLTITNPVTGCKAKDSTAIIVNCSYLPLPLTLLSFQAYKRGTTVLLQWEVASEKNIYSYTIQRSSDGSNWKDMGNVMAKNNTPFRQQYNFTDSKPLLIRNLYRLKINESDGSNSYSTVKMIEMGASQSKLLIYPNPADRQINIAWNVQATAEYILTDAAGRKMLNGKLMAGVKNAIDVSKMPAGFYVLKVVSKGVFINTSKVEIRH